jgi:hypothetical protein
VRDSDIELRVRLFVADVLEVLEQRKAAEIGERRGVIEQK